MLNAVLKCSDSTLSKEESQCRKETNTEKEKFSILDILYGYKQIEIGNRQKASKKCQCCNTLVKQALGAWRKKEAAVKNNIPKYNKWHQSILKIGLCIYNLNQQFHTLIFYPELSEIQR